MCVCVFILGNIRFKDLEYSIYFDVFRFSVSHIVEFSGCFCQCFASSAATPNAKAGVDKCKNEL